MASQMLRGGPFSLELLWIPVDASARTNANTLYGKAERFGDQVQRLVQALDVLVKAYVEPKKTGSLQ